MQTANEAYLRNDYAFVREILLKYQSSSPGESDVRDFAWRYLWNASDDRSLRSRNLPAENLTLSNNQRWLAVTDNERQIHILDYPSLKTLATIPIPVVEKRVHYPRPRFSPDDKRLYVFAHNETFDYQGESKRVGVKSSLRIYDTSTWSLLDEIANTQAIHSSELLFSSQGEPIVAELALDPETQNVQVIEPHESRSRYY